jgi:hypothetical protein
MATFGLVRLGARVAAVTSQNSWSSSSSLHTSASNSWNANGGERIKCTMIPGDGVGPELMDSVEEAIKAIGAPIDFEKFQLSEVIFVPK